MFACVHGQGNLTALAFEFSPVVEETAPGTVTFDVSGLDRLFGLPQEIAAAIARRAREADIQAGIAVASNPDAAICAARGFSGVSVIPYGDEAKFLAPLPLTLLSPSPELLETLERWGIRRFHEMAALPPLGIAERLGREGLRIRELARGEFGRKLIPLEDAPPFEDDIELEYPVDLLEPLLFLFARMVNGLVIRLATRGLATNELRLRLSLEDRSMHERTLRLPVPSLDTKAFLKLLQLDLEAHPPKAPVMRLWMGVNPVKPQAAQKGLFVPATPEPVKLELTSARIESIVGQGRVGTPAVFNTHRPDAFQLKRGGPVPNRSGPSSSLYSVNRAGQLGLKGGGEVLMAFRVFRPPRSARVAVVEGRLSFVAAEGARGRVLEAAGPWRTSGDWWTANPWNRDEWDIALSDGGLYRIYCEAREWFVAGSYD